MTASTETDALHAGGGGVAVACDVIDADGTKIAERVSIEYADEVLRDPRWAGASKGNFLFAASDYATLRQRYTELEAQVADMDRLLRASVPERWKGATSPVGAVQSYIAELEPYREAVFDGYAVFAALSQSAQRRTSHDNVADTLDALHRVAKKATP